MLERLLGLIDPVKAGAISRALDGHDLSEEEVVELLGSDGLELFVLAMAADEVRRRLVGDVVTYVVNRNINFTNICIMGCGFCAFSKEFRSEEGYFLPLEEIVARAREAWEYGATEVCIQAGLAPKMDPYFYVKIVEAIKREVPDIHIHAFSPVEVVYGAALARVGVEEYLRALRDAGLGSMPGTAAEILDDEIRAKISPGRISVDTWVRVIKTAHRLGIRSTSTIMYGHVENERHIARHLLLLREIQRETGGFTEFIPLSFVHREAPMWKYGLVEGVRPGPTWREVIALHAVARLAFHRHIPHIQASWVKEGPRMAQMLLEAGCDDLGGTLMNESISTTAGASHGQLMRPSELRALIRGVGRIPAQRTTLYQIIRVFDSGQEARDRLDEVSRAEARFGTYWELTRDPRFKRFKRSL